MKLSRYLSWFGVFATAVIALLLFVLLQVYHATEGQLGAASWFRTYPGLIVALAAGFFGATFSMLLQTQRRASEGTLEDLSNQCSWRTLMVRSFFGIGGAAILYFFFSSGLLEGSLWPKLPELAYQELVDKTSGGLVANKEWCLLVIWCFLGGFSETLVPNILRDTEAKASAK